MKYMLDTNICIYIIKQKPIEVIQKLRSLDVSDVCISSISLSELENGVSKSAHPLKNKIALTQFLGPIDIYDFDDKAAEIYGSLRTHLEKNGTPIGPLDTLIGAHALSLDYTLVTNNVKEFNRIEELKIENWTH
jgi:tRNA(fMet)-specific endonuclease VapC